MFITKVTKQGVYDLSWYFFKTGLLLFLLSGLLLFIGYLFGGADGLSVAFILTLVMNGLAYFYSDKIVLKMYKAQPFDIIEYSQVHKIVKEICQDADLPMSKL